MAPVCTCAHAVTLADPIEVFKRIPVRSTVALPTTVTEFIRVFILDPVTS